MTTTNGREYQSASARQLPVCPVCSEFTYDTEACEHRLPAPLPMPETAHQVAAQACGVHLVGDVCDCPTAEATWLRDEMLAGSATYGGWS